MSSRLNPAHDRVALSVDERRAVAKLERALAAESCIARRGDSGHLIAWRTRWRALRSWLRWSACTRWRIPVGVFLLLVLVQISITIAVFAALLLCAGTSEPARRCWKRARRCPERFSRQKV